MTAPGARQRCVGCGAEFAPGDGPVHRYLESAPGCWARYGELLAREYADRAVYPVHRLSVDAYAVQHPGRESPQTIQSAAVHLIRLSLLLEQGLAPERANAVMVEASGRRTTYRWLEPPPVRGTVTVADLDPAAPAAEYVRAVRRWAEDVWAAWQVHHDTVRRWRDERVRR
ncbi:MAG: hypothetical protein JSR54_18300 [Proteobacteria bacterium]|nr:hypothetical protein [Pseudomonadota bacterium]